jgi:Ca2+-binding EF-hand superfamily protein
MLSQLDTNGNEMIDLDEMQGPARFMLERLARDNPSIDVTKPVSIKKIAKAIESRMRGDSGSSSSSSSDSPDTTPESNEPEPLVPGFGVSDAPEPIPGFGQDADKYSVKIEERDLQEAADRISRYDKNKDGLIDESELKDGRWTDNPMQYDRNRDNKLNKQELAVRYARRRVSSDEGSGKKENSTASKYSRNKPEEKPEVVDPWKAQAHYRITPKTGKFAKVQGVQGWFTTSDADGDGQVMMHEFASNWDDSTVQEFRRFDTNSDGTITTAELLAAVKNGVMRGSGGVAVSASVAGGSSGSVPVSTGSGATAMSSPAGGGGFDPTGVEPKWVSFLDKGMAGLDRDKNKRITADEWPASNGEFNKVDSDQDGVVSMLEWYNARKKR